MHRPYQSAKRVPCPACGFVNIAGRRTCAGCYAALPVEAGDMDAGRAAKTGAADAMRGQGNPERKSGERGDTAAGGAELHETAIPF